MKNQTLKYMIILLVFLSFSCNIACERDLGVSPIIKPKTILNWSADARPRFFYPSIDLSDIEKQVVNQMYEGLTRTECDDVLLGMAESIDISSGELVYDIKLRKAQWSDGRLINTDDFIYSWERKDNYFEDVNLLYFDNFIQNVQILDEHNLRIILSQKNDDLLKSFSTVAFMPLRRDIVNLDLPTPIFLSDVTNGPFTLASHDFMGGIKLSRNVHYYDYYNISLDKIYIQFRSDDMKVYQEFKNGELDIVQNIDMTQYDKLLQNEPEFLILNKPGVYGFSINNESPELRDIRVRQLLNVAIDRSEINPYSELILNSESYSIFGREVLDDMLADTIDLDVIASVESLNPDKPYVDTDRVNRLLSDIDESVIESLDDITITTSNRENDILIAEMLKESWSENLGIEVNISPEDRYDYAFIRRAKSYDIILDSKYYIDYQPRHMFKYFFSDTKLNHSQFSSEKFDSMMRKTIGNIDSNLHKLYKTALSEVDDIALIIPMFNTQEPVLMSSNVEQWSRSYESLFYFGRAIKKEEK